MSHFTQWFDYKASLKILVFGILAGAALPGLFALGVRLQAVGSGHVEGAGKGQRNPALIAAAYIIFGLVVVVILLALLYISRDFISHNLGSSFLGGKVGGHKH